MLSSALFFNLDARRERGQTLRDGRFTPGKVPGGLHNFQFSGYWRSFTDYSG